MKTPSVHVVHVLALWLALLSPLVTCRAHSGPLAITSITPAGWDVPQNHQVVIEFDRPMVPLGQMVRPAAKLPITVQPALPCQWRWLSVQALACNLDDRQSMALASRYTVTIEPGIVALDGSSLMRPHSHHFTTERPTISHALFNAWAAPGIPQLKLLFNQPVSRRSVARYLRLWLTEPGAARAIEVFADPDDTQSSRFVRSAGQPWREPGSGHGGGDEVTGGDEARRSWLVQPRHPLPLGSAVRLQLAAGLESIYGSVAGVAREDILAFRTFPEFRFLGLRCTSTTGERLLLRPHSSVDAGSAPRCDPQASVELVFTAPLLLSELRRGFAIEPALESGDAKIDPWGNLGDFSRLPRPYNADVGYGYRLSARLEADQAYRLTLAATLRDEFGRLLDSEVKLEFGTDHRKPGFNLVHKNAVLEAGINSEPPLYVTNLDAVQLDYRRVDLQGLSRDQTLVLEPAPVKDLSFAVPLGVRSMLNNSTGVVYGSIAATPAPSPGRSAEQRFFAQVTPYQVHAKVGHFDSLVWVTDLASGEPVAGASVALYRGALSQLGPLPPDALTVETDTMGIARLPGTWELDPGLQTFGYRCHGDDCQRLLVRVEGGQGMALLPLNVDFRVYPHRVSDYSVFLNQRARFGHIHSWGLTAQGVYRAGDTIAYKLYVRDQDGNGFVAAPQGDYQLELRDATGKVVHQRNNVSLNDFGALQGEFRLPANSVMGWYTFHLKANFTEYQWQPMRVLVSDFTPASFRVSNALNGDLFRPGGTLATTTRAQLHSGGVYTQAGARVTVNLSAAPFQSEHAGARGFRFDTHSDTHWQSLHGIEGELDNRGVFTDALVLPSSDIIYGRLTVESAVRDDRGQYVAATSAADYIGVDRLVGLRKERWVFEAGDAASIDYLVVDERGEPVADTPVKLAVERLQTRAARVKGAGNAYTTRYHDTWLAVGACEGQPDGQPLACEFNPQQAGRYRIVATVLDSEGHSQSTTLSAWVVGEGEVVWRDEPGYALSLTPEKDSYQVGDQARFLVNNPYPGATALVTLERYGILRQWQMPLHGATPVIEFPIEADYVPGAYLSVLVFSPRVADPPVAAERGSMELDLAKPSFRLGYATLPVEDPDNKLVVTAAVEKDTYKPGERVQVHLDAKTPAAPVELAERLEYAVVVLDEAVFDLIAEGRDYFDPHRGFNALDGLDVDNFSLLTRIVGRHAFESKGANSGGGGGPGQSLRSIFDFVAYWNPSLPADAGGEAGFSFTLPDNLTGWRVLVLAVTPTDRFGLGEASFKTNQPTELRAVMPNQVAEGDRFAAGFSVMNRSAGTRTLQVSIDVAGDVAPAEALRTELTLGAHQRARVVLDVVAALQAVDNHDGAGEVTFNARAWDDSDGDAMVHRVPVSLRRPLEQVTAFGSLPGTPSLPASAAEADVADPSDRVEAVANATLALQIPEGIIPERGELAVQLSPTVLTNIDGAFRAMRDYGYSCWEQRLSRALMAAHFNSQQARLSLSLQWPDSQLLPEQVLQRAAEFQAPNGGMSYFLPRDSHASPYLSAYTALVFQQLRRAGHAIPGQVEKSLQGYLQRLLRRDTMPDFYSSGMSATVRAVALNALASQGSVDAGDLHRHAPLLGNMDLFGAANLLAAALQVEQRAPGGLSELVGRIRMHLLSRATRSADMLSFDEELETGFARILSTPQRSQCAILSALSRDPATDVNQATALLHSITRSRGGSDQWQNTQENLFCTQALIDYARRWEAEDPAMTARVEFGGDLLASGRFAQLNDPALEFIRPLTADDVGRRAELEYLREGTGRLHYSARLSYALREGNGERINAGLAVRREYAVQRDGRWQLLDSNLPVQRGELVRVDLFVQVPTARQFVVVDDPVAGGLEPVNRLLATVSSVDAASAGIDAEVPGSWRHSANGWRGFGHSRWGFYHRELKHDAVCYYADYLPPGRYHLTYVAQVIADGRFTVAPTEARAMYQPDVFGRSLPLTLVVGAEAESQP